MLRKVRSGSTYRGLYQLDDLESWLRWPRYEPLRSLANDHLCANSFDIAPVPTEW